MSVPDTIQYQQLDIEGLDITVTSGSASNKPSTAKGKAKASKSGEGTEVLANAKLRLKAGQRYAVIGRNGSGKSTLLKAIAEKLIPGVPEETRIAILQQTDVNGADTTEGDAAAAKEARPVLEHVIEKATSKDELEHEIAMLSEGVNSGDGVKAASALRRLRHERLQKRLFVLDKMARLRSGARGMTARKELLAFEKKVAESAAL